MASTEKARMISLKIKDAVALRQSALTVVEGAGTSGDPLITIGPGTTGTASAVIRVVPDSASLAKDILGNSSQVYATHTIQLGSEANRSSGSAADNLSRQQLADILATIVQMGAKVEWYEEAYGTPAAESTLGDSTKLKATFSPNVRYTMDHQ